MKIAIIGIRGIPVIYSGFETLAEELSVRLVKKGFEITVYCRKGYVQKKRRTYRGVKLVTLPSVRSKNWETFSHSLVSTLHALFQGFDAIYYLGVGSAPFAILPKLFGKRIVINVDGLDWKREKWGPAAKAYLAVSELIASFLADEIVTDSKFIQKYYRRKFSKKTKYISYGFLPQKIKNSSVLTKYGLRPKKYLVWVGRLVPDNHADELINAFLKFNTRMKCVLIGDNSNPSNYKGKLVEKVKANKQVIFTGFLNRDLYANLVSHAFAYIETKRSGGAHPSLIEAMGFGSLIISNNHPANREVLGKGAIYYRAGLSGDLAKKIRKAVDPRWAKEAQAFKKLARARAKKKYNWEDITEKYESLFKRLVVNLPDNKLLKIESGS